MSKLNNIRTRLQVILKTLAGGIHFDEVRGNEGILVGDITSTIIDNLAGATSRRYVVPMTVFFKSHGNKKQTTDMLSRRIDKVEDKLNEEVSHYDGTTYYWHDGQVVETAIEENDEGMIVGNMTFECTITEVL
tara:strand:+ start:483 stop:881 length:399 start_codon:yes stop_codon:yes gene_type:complete